MVIQRIQTLWLIIAICMMIAATVPAIGTLAVLIVNALTIILLAVSIFMFKNLRQQMLVTRVNVLLTLAAAATQATVSCVTESCFVLGYATLCALVFEFLALRGMRKDYKLLSGSDRLR